ncbi:FAD/NAD(P)-binding protein [Alkalibacterium sp. 20]|uniref:FAD/NAD(P)-binding protein n=1 Tax=Alkalibacterium sp. 20 TaxID=1798803 RepID=UPI00090022F0|nr:FAD/NAD(P)-binding protein [Alkalibacterium sp. 20]OJF95330.1 hypothetical protein AX762_06690 [Alkalibacterium sp. 20]
MKIGIIGLGVAGISILREIEKQTQKDMRGDLHITVYAEKESFGTGFPYQPDDEALLINQYTETMSIDPDDSNDFLEWVRENKNLKQLYNTHLPRNLFGEYLLDKSRELIEKLNVTVICVKVLSVKRQENNQYEIKTKNSTETTDCIHLSVGHLAYQDPYNLKGEEKYIYNPYPANKKLSLQKGPIAVGIVGTGLTALDTFLYIRKYYPEAKLSFLSLDGRFSSVRGHEPKKGTHAVCQERVRQLVEENQQLTLDQIKEWVEKETADRDIDLTWIWKTLGEGTLTGLQRDLNHLEELGKFQMLIHQMRDFYSLLWNAMPDNEKDRFLNDFGLKWSNFKAPIPQRTAALLLKSISDGEVELLSGIKSIKKENGDFKVQINGQKTRAYDFIINATGQQMDLTKQLYLQQPLIKELIESGVLTPYRYGGVLIDYPSMTAISQKGERVNGLYVYGQLSSGIQYGNNNVELISKSAQYSVQDMLKI